MIRFVEEQTEVREHDPQLLPAVGILELSQKIAAQLILDCLSMIVDRHGEIAVPADVHGGVCAVLNARAIGRIGGIVVESSDHRMLEIFR